MSVEILGQKRLANLLFPYSFAESFFHHEGENAVAAAADKYRTLFGVPLLVQ